MIFFKTKMLKNIEKNAFRQKLKKKEVFNFLFKK